jgi:hypothetical protein
LKVVALVPDGKTNDDVRVVNYLKTKSKSMQFEFQEIKLVARSAMSNTKWCLDVSGRTSPMSLYREAHTSPLVVLSLRKRVTAMMEKKVDHERNRTIETLFRYKAFCKFTDIDSVETILDHALAWHSVAICSGLGDPKILPLHVFCPLKNQTALWTDEGCKKFEQIHRRNGVRHDSDGREWWRGAHHGSFVHTILGTTLPVGFHWDVQSNRKSTLWSGDSEWQIGPKGYVNISPDGSVRSGKFSKQISRRVRDR